MADVENQEKPYPGYPGGRTYYLSVPLRPLTDNISDEHLQRLTLYFTVYGLVFAAAGAVAIVFPFVLGVTLLTLMPWLLMIAGAITLLQFVLVCGAPGTTSFLLLSALHIAAGVLLILLPDSAYKRLIFLLAGWFGIHGVVKLLMGCQLRKLSTWWAVVASGIASVIFALAILIMWVISKYNEDLVSIFFGADLISTGVSMLLIACMAFLGRGNRAVSDLDNTPLLDGRAPPAPRSSD